MSSSSNPGPPPLAALPPLLRDEPALRQVAGRHAAVLAVPEAARALTVAALAHLSDRRPIVVAVPTGTAAQHLAEDLVQYLGGDAVEQFPAWETLPFERVSPAVETMGRRLQVLGSELESQIVATGGVHDRYHAVAELALDLGRVLGPNRSVACLTGSSRASVADRTRWAPLPPSSTTPRWS